MDELYLILHKVRGRAAIDVATRVHLSGGREIWFIPTSGHRAYPLQWQALDPALRRSAEQIEGSAWAALPDHYARATQRNQRGLVARLRARLRAALTAWV